MERWLSSHSRKLLWALWTPFGKIDPAHFTEAKQQADKLHARRMMGLYVDPLVDGALPAEMVKMADAQSIIDYAKLLLRQTPTEAAGGRLDERSPELLEWFLRAVEDEQAIRVLLSPPSLAKYEEFGADAAKWALWAKGEFERRTAESEELVRQELLRQPGLGEKPRWKIRTRVFTPSHSLRQKTLNYWNDKIDMIKLVWCGKKDEFLLELSLGDAVLLSDLYGRALGMTKMLLAFLSIGSIGYFWFERPVFSRPVFEEVKDLEKPGFHLEIAPQKFSFWGTDRVLALGEDHLQRAIECMAAYIQLDDKTAEPIFGPYFQGLAVLAKSDIHVSTEPTVRAAFMTSLRGAMRQFGGWDGLEPNLLAALDIAFTPIIPDPENRKRVLAALRPPSVPAPISEETVTTKHLVDLLLVRNAREQWLQFVRSQPKTNTATEERAAGPTGGRDPKERGQA